MGWVLASAVTVDGEVYAEGTMPPPDVATRIGEHARRYVEEGGSLVSEVVEIEPEPIQIEDPSMEAEGITEVNPPVDEVASEAAEVRAPEEDAEGEGVSLDPGPTMVGPEVEKVEAPEDFEAQASEAAEGSKPQVEVPPKRGPGSAKSAWADYARANDVAVDPGASRDDIIRDLEDAGVPTE
ncbi:hypothetical protein KIH74_22940 [Kineosporia sp. J2-2]|uniref:Lsr2 protein n=1 Tax=Kineosporia corallincola TaxID=2835133 RepID=A0ABS5TL57_9ACTN|nr:hypothetical protein [Kineosporia corallincola]MBT0771816.1 hypothetical protein [Kineosporia corallincola]